MTSFKPLPARVLELRLDELVLCVLAAVMRVRLTGLFTGVGNQALHMVFLEHLRDPERYRGDLLLETLPRFTTWFFSVFAALLPSFVPLEPVLMVAHVLTLAAIFGGFMALARGIWPEIRYPALILIPLVGLSLSGLAESPLNPLAFTHTSLAFALALLALNLLVRGRLIAAGALIGCMANIHVLTAGYTAALAGMWGLWRLRSLPPWRTLAGGAACIALASPILPLLQADAGAFDAAWVALLELRSAHHVFPSVWWQTGNPAIGRFALWCGVAAVARGLAGGRNRHLDPWLAAAAVLMVAGWVGAELTPIPIVMRAQLFRASGFVVAAALLFSVRAADRFLRYRPELSSPLRLVAPIVAVLLAGMLWLPSGQGFTAPLLLVAAWLACVGRRLSAGEALVAGTALVVVTVSDLHLQTTFWQLVRPPIPGLELTLLLAGLTVLAVALAFRPWLRLAVGVWAVQLVIGGLLLWPAGEALPDPWADIQALAAAHTPADAVILTPPRQSGFRLGAGRAIVGEWRDGTQQFFDPGFAAEWARRMEALDPGRTRDFSADDWIAAAAAWGADYLVLPVNERLPLIRVAANETWMLCRAERPPPPPLADPPREAQDLEDWFEQERFMAEVVAPALRRHRMSGVSLHVTDGNGDRLPGVALSVEQIARAFHIGSAFNHFSEPAAPARGFRAPVVDERELALFPRVFNYSTIGYSGKWDVLEPVEDARHLEPLDRYIDWCHQHGIEVEYHFVCGYEPRWLRDKSRSEQQAALLRHANDLIDRYGDRVSIWQIVNERRLQALAPPVFELFRERLPDARLGVSHCARFYSDRDGERRERDLLRGWDSVEELQAAGAVVDYFGVHAHRPFGTWWDPRVIYEVLDEYAARGLRVRVTETGVSYAGAIQGSVLTGEWDEALQADYLERFLTVLYSHPNVDAVNFWGFGPHTWQRAIGLLDDDYEPRPAFHVLDRLVNEDWLTREQLETNRFGEARFTGFHGRYRLTARLPDGREAEVTFELGSDTPERLEVALPL